MEDHMKLRTLSAALLAAAAVALPGMSAQASSHREAPFITEMPKVDGTDFYMFRSYEPGRENYVTIVANYHPLQDAYGGPNYFSMDPDALYEIHIDNNGDGKEDITFQFNFDNDLIDDPTSGARGAGLSLPIGGKNIAIPLKQFGQVFPDNAGNLNEVEKFKVTVVRGDRRFGRRSSVTNVNATNFVTAGAKTFVKPVDNIGTKTLPDYASYAAQHIYDIRIPGCSDGRMFVGQRKEGFVVNLGETFDLINIADPIADVPGDEAKEPNTIGKKNITSLALEVPISCLTNGDPVIGGWTTASVRQARLLRRHPSFDLPALEGGPWAQVSRLGSPLVNELVIGLKDKDRFNSSEPKDDGQFADYVTNPTLPALIDVALGTSFQPNNFPRNDLVAAFLTGVKLPAGTVFPPVTGSPLAADFNLNQPANVKPAEMLRLNTGIDPTPKGSQSRLGVLGLDLAGFPNGRRPGDDVVDIELTAAEGILCVLFPGNAPFGCDATNVPAKDAFLAGATITDGAIVSDANFDGTFPYLNTPVAGSPNGVSD
jgi:hypothetical protein